jgi:hypothetical protein
MDDTNPEWNSRQKAQKARELGFLCLLRFFAAIWIVSYPADSCVILARALRTSPLPDLYIGAHAEIEERILVCSLQHWTCSQVKDNKPR